MEDSSTLDVATSGQVLTLSDLKNTLAAGTYRIKMLNIRNPYIATATTDNFVFEA